MPNLGFCVELFDAWSSTFSVETEFDIIIFWILIG